jgi:hypothetical protein
MRRTIPVLYTVNNRILPSGSNLDTHGLDPRAIVKSRVASGVAQLILIAGGLTTGQNPLSAENITLRLAEEEPQVNTMAVKSGNSRLVIASFAGFGADLLSSPFAKEDLELPTGKEQNIIEGLETLNQTYNSGRKPFEFEAYQAAYQQIIAQAPAMH